MSIVLKELIKETEANIIRNLLEKEKNKLASTYNITNVHAECYLCNYKDKYICTEFNGGCDSLDKCSSIYEKEQSK